MHDFHLINTLVPDGLIIFVLFSIKPTLFMPETLAFSWKKLAWLWSVS